MEDTINIKEDKLEDKINLERKNENVGGDEKIDKVHDINTEILNNLNSPSEIQHILQLTTHTSKIDFELENNIIKSFLSVNNIITNILDDEKEQDEFNPYFLTQNKKKDLYRLSFEQANITNNFLNKKIKQYNELKDRISEYNNAKNDQNLENSDEKNKKYLYFIQHPLINIFEEEHKINITELKNEIKNDYLNRMKDNTNYKHKPNLLDPQNALNIDDDNNENDNDNDNDAEDEDNDEVMHEESESNSEHYISDSNSENENENLNNNPPNNMQNQVIPVNNNDNENNNQNNNNNNNNNFIQQILQMINPNNIFNNQNNLNQQNNGENQN